MAFPVPALSKYLCISDEMRCYEPLLRQPEDSFALCLWRGLYHESYLFVLFGGLISQGPLFYGIIAYRALGKAQAMVDMNEHIC